MLLHMLKAIIVATSLVLLLGCTSTYNIRYSVNSVDSGSITDKDIKKINESLLSDPNIDPASGPNTYYLSKHKDAWEILKVENDDSSLFLSVTRITKKLGSFSDNWKEFFKSRMENLIEEATNKSINLQQVSD